MIENCPQQRAGNNSSIYTKDVEVFFTFLFAREAPLTLSSFASASHLLQIHHRPQMTSLSRIPSATITIAMPAPSAISVFPFHCQMKLRGAAMEAFKSSALISWRSTGKQQQTIGDCVEITGRALHSGNLSTVRIWPELAGRGRYFDFCSLLISASIDFAEESPLCTTLRKDGHRVRTVEHLLSALEGTCVDNCRIEIVNSDSGDTSTEVPILDGSAREWVEAIDRVGLTNATDCNGRGCDRVAPYLTEPVRVSKGDSVIAAFPSNDTNISYGINFPQVIKKDRRYRPDRHAH